MSAGVQVIDWEGQRARTGPWRGDPQHVALLGRLSRGPALSARFLSRCLDLLADEGYERVITGALGPIEQIPFFEVGFEVERQLVVLRHDLGAVPVISSRQCGLRVRRGGRGDMAPALEVDSAAFPAFWRLDQPGLDDALAATPRSRFIVATIGSHRRAGTRWYQRPRPVREAILGEGKGRVVAYLLTGLASRQGFLQRLAVDPAARRHGIASSLVVDALDDLRRGRAEVAFVNTEPGNAPALRLYRNLGFVEQPVGLSVLGATLSR